MYLSIMSSGMGAYTHLHTHIYEDNLKCLWKVKLKYMFNLVQKLKSMHSSFLIFSFHKLFEYLTYI